jgi:hypothetical protein
MSDQRPLDDDPFARVPDPTPAQPVPPEPVPGAPVGAAPGAPSPGAPEADAVPSSTTGDGFAPPTPPAPPEFPGAAPYGTAPHAAGPYAAGPYAAGPYVGVPPTTSAKAIASLVLSLVYACGLGSLAAVVLGHLARGEIRRSGGRIGGTGLATAGLVLGYLGLAVTLVIGTGLAVAAFRDVSGSTVLDLDDGSDAPPEPSAPPQPVSGVCPDVAALAEVLPPTLDYVLGSSTRDERGVIDCVYGQPGVSGGGDLVLVALQDDLTTLSVDAYFTERELDPPALDELGTAAGTADRFGIDRYVAPGTTIDYIDTGAARGERSAVISVPEAFGIPTQTLFVTTVEVLDGIRTPDNVV